MKLRRYAGDAAALLVLCAALVAIFFPYVFILIASLKDVAAINRPLEWNFTPTLANWAAVVRSDIPRQAWNSLLVGAWTAAISLVTGAPAAYAFSRFRVGGDAARFVVLSAQMLPPAVLIVPLFLLMYTIRLLNTPWAVIAAHLTFILPFVVWFLIGFFDDIPRELEEQAMVDGCTPWQAFYRVLLPVARPGLGAAALFAFILSWNDLFYALLLSGGDSRTLPVGVAGYWTFRGVELGQMSAAILLSITPMIGLSFLVQRYLVRGFGGGVIKG